MKFTMALLAMCVAYANADCYMHNPRGSNNRLNEASAERDQGARMFDSQNNGRGGYNACDHARDAGNAAANNADDLRVLPSQAYSEAVGDLDTAIQYPMMFYEGSQLQMEWAVQHGCGGTEATDPTKLNCNMVIQYVCDQDIHPTNPINGLDTALSTRVASGLNTNQHDTVNCQDAGDQAGNVDAAEAASDAASNGRHESQGWYCECQQRNRNQQLFTADQNLNGDQSIYTRQNAGGNRNGLECAEERDYYPYWAPTPWRDLAYLTDDPTKCDMVRLNSQNNNDKYKCATFNNGAMVYDKDVTKGITSAECVGDGGTWTRYKAWGLPSPDCQLGQFSRPNYLGNGRGDGVTPTTLHYNATLPSWTQLTALNPDTAETVVTEQEYVRCAMRLRYNVSTDDYDPWNTDVNNNDIIEGNPTVEVGAAQPLDIALNTDQYGRTFQDRSHAFYIRKAPAVLAAKVAEGRKIFNLNVRGKRGNIVETYPSTEYDFVPTNLNVAQEDLVHLQWCGSLTHNNGANGGDGQTGDSGEGAGGSDKHNLVQLLHFDSNYPAPYEKMAQLGMKNLFGDGNICTPALTPDQESTDIDCALRAATAGFYLTATAQGGNNEALQVELNNIPAGTRGAGQLLEMKAEVGTTYRYASTRNNNFTNRGHKGVARIVMPKRTPVA